MMLHALCRPTYLCVALATLATQLVLSSAALAQEQALPPGGKPMLVDLAEQDIRMRPGNSPASLTYQFDTATDMPFDRVTRVSTHLKPENPWEQSIHISLPGSFDKQKMYLIDFYVRCLDTEDESGVGKFIYWIERSGGDHKKLTKLPFTATSKWQHVLNPFRPTESQEAGESQIAIHLGHLSAQTLEFGGFQVWEYDGEDLSQADFPSTRYSYEGREPDAAWRAEADDRIRQHRMADFNIQVVDAEGKSVPDAQVHVAMQRHAFHFGMCVNLYLLAGDESNFPFRHPVRVTGGLPEWTYSDALIFRDHVAENFNRIVFEGTFRPWVYQENADRKPILMRALDWLDERHIDVRGHCIAWGMINDKMRNQFNDDGQSYRRYIFDYINTVFPEVGDRLAEFDTINHPVNGNFDMAQFVGDPEVYPAVMQAARQVAPSNLDLYVNEGNILAGGSNIDDYTKFIQHLRDAGQGPDGIGFMSHYHAADLRSPESIYAVLEHFAPMAKELGITELDIEAPGDPQLQADYLRDFMTITFSHPKIDSITQWGMWAGRHWKPGAALWDAKWRPRPALQAYRDLVFKQWWTDETLSTDATGSATGRGFLGSYTITATYGSKEVSIQAELTATDKNTYIVKLP